MRDEEEGEEMGTEDTSDCNLPFFGRPLTPVLEWRSFSATFFNLEGESGFVGVPPSTAWSSSLGCLARRRALCLGLTSIVFGMTITRADAPTVVSKRTDFLAPREDCSPFSGVVPSTSIEDINDTLIVHAR